MKPTVELIWRDRGNVQRKTLPWRRAKSNADLNAWMEEYFDLLAAGYKPAGHAEPPIPHCARVHFAGRVVAEWKLKPGLSAESLVTAEVHPAPGCVPEVVPVPPQEAKPNFHPTAARAVADSVAVTMGVPGDTGRRSPVDPGNLSRK